MTHISSPFFCSITVFILKERPGMKTIYLQWLQHLHLHLKDLLNNHCFYGTSEMCLHKFLA